MGVVAVATSPTTTDELWCCGEIEILIHHHVCCAPYEPQSPFYKKTMDRFTELGLLAVENGQWTSTPKGQAFISMLLRTPIPEQKFVDPRSNHIVGLQ